MEICKVFEDRDGSEIEEIARVERLLLKEEESAQKPEEDVAAGSNDEDKDESSFKCSKCKKVYHTMGLLKRHEQSCSGAKGKAETNAGTVRPSNEEQKDSCRPRF